MAIDELISGRAASLEERRSPLLRARLRVPHCPAHFSRRQRLDGLLDELVAAPLTLVVAPAGAGKTLLLAGWIEESSIDHAWLSLDEGDRDGVQLWSDIITALDTLVPGSGADALVSLRRAAPLAEVVGHLLEGLDAHLDRSTILVIDDVHLIDDLDELTDSLGLFLLHLPPQLHVVLLARRDPRLPLDRLRARGQIGEVRFAELRFSRDEASEMLRWLAPALSSEQVEATVDSADGWAAGLQLMALAARSANAQMGAATPDGARELLIDDYVWHEVLAQEDADLVDTMIDLAVVDRMNASLGEAVTGRQDVGERLQGAEARGLFVTRRGVTGWFEAHALVRAALLAELTRRSPARRTELHAKAARWFEEEGEATAALEHWLAAGRPRDALRVLTANILRLHDAGRGGSILRSIEAIPIATVADDLRALLDFAWCLLLVDRRRFVAVVGESARRVQHTMVPAELHGRFTMLRASERAVNCDSERAGELARVAIEMLGEGCATDPVGRYAWSLVTRAAAMGERWNEGGAEVRDAELAARRDPESRLALDTIRSIGLALAGRPTEALQVAAGVRSIAPVSNMTILDTELAIAEAIAHRELGDRARALDVLETLAATPMESMIHARILALVELVHAELDAGDVDAARAMFERVGALMDDEGIGDDAVGWLARAGTRLALAGDQNDEARAWAGSIEDAFWRAASTAQVDLADGRVGEALAALDAAVPRCPRHEVIRELLRARAIEDHDESVHAAARALEIAAANGMMQTVVSNGAAVPELMERAAVQAPAPWQERLRRLTAGAGDRPADGRLELVEPLSDRERDVMRFLPSRLTTKEIADELFISVNTLKFHLKVIYRKLEVGSRAEAVEKARLLRRD